MSLERGKELLRGGHFVLIHDSNSRENEVDLVVLAEEVTPDHVGQMRRDGGGLICVALHPTIADNFGLPYLTEIYESARSRFKILDAARADDIPYDEGSAFSISVNHRKTFTGITDADRALTISELGKLGREALEKQLVEEFGRKFRTPGHVPLLRAADGLLGVRRGHTELSVTLAVLAGATPVTAICEILDPAGRQALSVEKAARYAEKAGTVLLEGEEIEEAWRGR
jgi:3,4-dihydroxy 2-butanone 4-phosphate synthase